MLKENSIQFVSRVPYLSQIDECVPKPMNKAIPHWWKDTEYNNNHITTDMNDFGNVKHCPSFSDYFSTGYYLPMWADSIISYNRKTEMWSWKTSDKSFVWDYHPTKQFVDIAHPTVYAVEGYAVFKAVSPWSVFTPKGYSLLQFPLFYNFNKDFTVLPGVIATDARHTLNIQILIHSDKEEIFIERGTPLAQYIPVKRNDALSLKYRDANKKDLQKIDSSDMRYHTKFSHRGEYSKIRKQIDKEVSR
jgi:hypothetical protein